MKAYHEPLSSEKSNEAETRPTCPGHIVLEASASEDDAGERKKQPSRSTR